MILLSSSACCDADVITGKKTGPTKGLEEVLRHFTWWKLISTSFILFLPYQEPFPKATPCCKSLCKNRTGPVPCHSSTDALATKLKLESYTTSGGAITRILSMYGCLGICISFLGHDQE